MAEVFPCEFPAELNYAETYPGNMSGGTSR